MEINLNNIGLEDNTDLEKISNELKKFQFDSKDDGKVITSKVFNKTLFNMRKSLNDQINKIDPQGYNYEGIIDKRDKVEAIITKIDQCVQEKIFY